MTDRIVSAVLPESYAYKNTDWYKKIQKDHNRFRYYILLFSYLSTTMIPVVSLFYDLLQGKTGLMLNYSLASAAMILMLIYLLIFKNVIVMTVVTIITAFTGFYLAVLLPGDHGAHIIVLFNFIPLVFSITDSRTGAVWSVSFIALNITVLAVYLLTGGELFPLYVNMDYTVISIISVMTMFGIIYSASRQHEKVIRSLVKNIVYDNVTSLPNRDSFTRCIEGMDDSIIAILQIKNFKNLATIFGYEFSERMLVYISGALKDISEKTGSRVFKLTWHEFGLQIPFNRYGIPSKAVLILTGIVNELSRNKIQWDNKELNPVICAGGVIVRNGEYNGALSKADNALLLSLTHNRTVVLHDSSMDIKKSTLDDARRYSVLHDNIIHRTLKSYLQNVVDTVTGELAWNESLLMVKSAEGVYESVSRYLRVAKSTGLYPLLTEFMLDEARIHLGNTGVPVSVNICPADIINDAVFEKIKSITEDASYKNGSLILELIESEEIENVQLCIEFINRVRSLGVQVAIDDFGSGYSNIANLMKFGVDIVKIDGELIRRLDSDDEAYSLIKGVSAFCINSGSTVVAEFVENKEIYSKVKELNIHLCQGYHFCRPFDPGIN